MLIKEVINGYASRVRLENSLQLQKAKEVRPPQVKLEIAAIHRGIAQQLATDPELKAQYDAIKLEIPA